MCFINKEKAMRGKLLVCWVLVMGWCQTAAAQLPYSWMLDYYYANAAKLEASSSGSSAAAAMAQAILPSEKAMVLIDQLRTLGTPAAVMAPGMAKFAEFVNRQDAAVAAYTAGADDQGQGDQAMLAQDWKSAEQHYRAATARFVESRTNASAAAMAAYQAYQLFRQLIPI